MFSLIPKSSGLPQRTDVRSAAAKCYTLMGEAVISTIVMAIVATAATGLIIMTPEDMPYVLALVLNYSALGAALFLVITTTKLWQELLHWRLLHAEAIARGDWVAVQPARTDGVSPRDT